MAFDLTPIPVLSDNYVWVFSHLQTKTAIAVDPGDAAPVLAFLEANGLHLEAIMVTHHHWDHVGGIDALKRQYGTTVFGPARENIEGVERPVREADKLSIKGIGEEIRVLDIPGHTAGHVGYLINDKLFCGDTLFSAGCGRLFEGTAEQLYHSLQKIASLPDDTRICCTHEYTLNNLYFALEVEPGNATVREHIRKVEDLMRRHKPSLPSTLALERRINPFLRVNHDSIIESVSRHIGRPIHDDLDCFTELRKWKDNY